MGEPVKTDVRAVAAGLLGWTLDGYDLSLTLVSSAILSSVFFPSSLPSLLSAFLVIFSYSITLIFRPMGAAIFGNLGDKIGRRNAMIYSIIGLGVSSMLVAALPTYNQLGYVAFGLFLVLRAAVGIFAGGEYAGGQTFSIEWTSPRWRGLVSGVVQSGYGIGSVLSTSIFALLLSVLGQQGMLNVGWRYLFLTGGIPFIVGIILRVTSKETPIFEGLKKSGKIEKTPFFSLFKGGNRKDFFQVMLMMTGYFLVAYAFLSYVPVILQHPPSKISLLDSTYAYLIGNIGLIVSYLISGELSQHFGRKRIGIIIYILVALLSIPVYYSLIQFAQIPSTALVYIITFIIGMFLAGYGILPAYLSERFKPGMRASGVGFGYVSGIFIGGWFSIYVPLLHNVFYNIDSPTNVWFSTGLLNMIGAILIVVGYFIGPETLGRKLMAEE